MEKQPASPKDAFMHFLSIIFLYVVVINLGILLFQLIDIYLPDVLYETYGRYSLSALRWPLAILVIIFPFYLWLSSYIQKDLIKNTEKRELKTRKWLLYFTLFATIIAIVIDLISLIFHFLDGELTIRFLLKVLAVLLIAGGVFTYYAWVLRRKIPPFRHPRMKFFIWAVIILAGAVIIWGFITAGSPQSERLKKFDDRRVENLQAIQFRVINYWQAKEALPGSLNDLRDEIYGWKAPTDPENGDDYDYKITGDKSFELCADFSSSNLDEAEAPIRSGIREVPVPPKGGTYYGENSWIHDVGYKCFERTIDPDVFPPNRLKQ